MDMNASLIKGIDFESNAFRQFAEAMIGQSVFLRKIKEWFGNDAAIHSCKAFGRLQLPVPEDAGEFMIGRTGLLIFSNVYGVVMRFEGLGDCHPFDRVNDNPWVLRPLATLKGGGPFAVEICPGTRLTSDKALLDRLLWKFMQTQVICGDVCFHNIGLLPCTTEDFPLGFPVVIDRISMRRIGDPVPDTVKPIFGNPQDILYGGLQTSFRKALRGEIDITVAWQECKDAVARGNLVAGWNAAKKQEYGVKAQEAKEAACAYDRKILQTANRRSF